MAKQCTPVGKTNLELKTIYLLWGLLMEPQDIGTEEQKTEERKKNQTNTFSAQLYCLAGSNSDKY